MSYTINNNPEIDKKIDQDIKYINSQILGLLGMHVHSIILCGSFGRGEGGVYIKDKKIHIVNDYDIIILLKKNNLLRFTFFYKKFKPLLHKLADKLALKLNVKQVDLDLKHASYFKNPKSLKIDNYEVKMGHVLTYGEEDITNILPDWRAKDIPLFEGTRLFRNRGAGLLIPALYFLSSGGIPESKKENFVIECNKAQLAMGDSILLLKGSYHHLYSERLKLIDTLEVSNIPSGQKILDHYREALEQKLKPNFQKFYQRNLVEWWFEITELFELFYIYFESIRLNKSINNWLDYVNIPKVEDRVNYKKLLKIFLTTKVGFGSNHTLRNEILRANNSFYIKLVSLLLFSIKRHDFNKKYIVQASKLLDISIDNGGKEDWLLLVKTLLNDWHPGGEVQYAISL